MCMPMGGGMSSAPQATQFVPPNPLEIVQDKVNRSDYNVAGSKGEEAFAAARKQMGITPKKSPVASGRAVADTGLQIDTTYSR